MELITAYLDILRNPTVPSHRVVRKTGVLCLLLVAVLVYHRHWTLGFGGGEPAWVTAALAFMVLGVVGIFGGLIAASFYDAFRKDVGAQRSELTVSVFFAEWLFALAAPLLGALAFGIFSSHME